MEDKYEKYSLDHFNPDRHGIFIQEVYTPGLTNLMVLDNSIAREMSELSLINVLYRLDGTALPVGPAEPYTNGIVYIYNITTDTYITGNITSAVDQAGGGTAVILSAGLADTDTVEVGYYAISRRSANTDILCRPDQAPKVKLNKYTMASYNQALLNKSPINFPELGYRYAEMFATVRVLTEDLDDGSGAVLFEMSALQDVFDYRVDYDELYPLFINNIDIFSYAFTEVKIWFDDSINEIEEIYGSDGTEWISVMDPDLGEMCNLTHLGGTNIFRLRIRLCNRRFDEVTIKALRTEEFGIGYTTVNLGVWYKPKEI